MFESTTTTGRSYCTTCRSTYSSEGDCACSLAPALLCTRALEQGDCPMGHDWGSDPRVRQPLHSSWATHLDALRWSELHPVTR